MKLLENEIILEEIEHSNRIPFRLEDMITIPFFIAFSCIISFIFFQVVGESKKDIVIYFIYPMAVLFAIFMTIGRIFIRWYKTKTSRFYISNQRIIFTDISGKLINKSFKLIDLEINYREDLNSNGFIIIGEQEPLFQGRGINFLENQDVMYNVYKVKEIFDKIKATKYNVV